MNASAKKKIWISFSPEVYEQLRKEAKSSGRPITKQILFIIENFRPQAVTRRDIKSEERKLCLMSVTASKLFTIRELADEHSFSRAGVFIRNLVRIYYEKKKNKAA